MEKKEISVYDIISYGKTKTDSILGNLGITVSDDTSKMIFLAAVFLCFAFYFMLFSFALGFIGFLVALGGLVFGAYYLMEKRGFKITIKK